MEDVQKSQNSEITESAVDELLTEAYRQFEVGHRAVATALGNAYTVIRLQKKLADQNWLQAKINDYNADIVAHNKQIDKTKGLSDDEKKAQKQSPAKSQDGASPFVAQVKFIFRFNHSSHSTNVTRYTRALDWVHRHFKNHERNLDLPEKIADRIVKAGGLTAIVSEQLEFERGNAKPDEAKADQAKVEAAVLDRKLSTMRNKHGLGSIPRNGAIDHNGLFLLVGKKNGENIDIVDVANVEADDIKAMVGKGISIRMSVEDEAADFMGRVLRLGQMAHERANGSSQLLNRGKVARDQTLDITRTVTLRMNKAERPEIVISSRRTSASAIVRAVPKNGALTTVSHPVYLRTRDRKRCESFLGNPESRWLFKVGFEHNPTTQSGDPAESPLKMNLENSVVKDASGVPKSDGFYWADLNKVESRPLIRADSFKPQFSIKITKDQIKEIAMIFGKLWPSAKAPKDIVGKFIHLEFKPGEILVTANGHTHGTVEIESQIARSYSLKFKAEDIRILISNLLQQHSSEFELNGDSTGMLQVTWDDDLADYDVSMPTVTDENMLNPKHCDTM